MTTTGTVWAMTRHQTAGAIVREELARRGLIHDKAAQEMGMSKSTLSRMIRGEEDVRDLTYRAIEGRLGFPRRFLDYVIAGDVERIKTLTMDEDLRRHVLAELSEGDRKVTHRRSKHA